MLMHLREIIHRPDISALGLIWREGAGPLVDGGVPLTSPGRCFFCSCFFYFGKKRIVR